MSKSLSPWKSIRQSKAVALATPSIQAHGARGRFTSELVGAAAAVVVAETRQQRRYKARQAAKNPLPLLRGGKS